MPSEPGTIRPTKLPDASDKEGFRAEVRAALAMYNPKQDHFSTAQIIDTVNGFTDLLIEGKGIDFKDVLEEVTIEWFDQHFPAAPPPERWRKMR